MARAKNRYFKNLTTFFLVVVFFLPGGVLAQSSSSSQNYKLDEALFGTGGEVDSSSTNYRAQSSTGALGVGQMSSDDYDATGGFLTQSDDFLEFVVSNGSVNLGTLDSAAASYASAELDACNCSFYVKSYLSSEYTVVSASQPPTSEANEAIDAKTVQGIPSSSGSVEEFGINLVANTSPGVFGNDPVNQPDDTFADGQAAAGYEIPNQYKYNPGDVIARSQATPGNPAIGLTEYTISYILKPSDLTPAGFYEMNQDLIALVTF